jgi:hypothetical protein
MSLSAKKNHVTLKPDNGSGRRRFDDFSCCSGSRGFDESSRGSGSCRFGMEGDAAAAQPGRRLLSLESEAAVAADAVRDMGALSGLGPSEQYFMSVEFTHTYIPYVHFSSHATVIAKVGGTYLETDHFKLNKTDCPF